MHPNRRTSVRRRLAWKAAVLAPDGTWRHLCKLLDVSASGAQLSVDPAIALPAEFFLAFTGSGRVWRSCLMVWRHEGRVGVRFLPERAPTT
jgi:hypothetical protein